MGVRKLLDAATATTTGATTVVDAAPGSVQVVVTGAGAVSATVIVEVSNDGANWEALDTRSPSGTTSASSSLAYGAMWAYMRARLTAISGAGAAVTAHLAN